MPHSNGKSNFSPLFLRISTASVELMRPNSLETTFSRRSSSPLVHEGVEKLHLLWAALDDGVYDVLDHRFGVVLVVKVGKRHLGLDHPEFGGVALSVGYRRRKVRPKV